IETKTHSSDPIPFKIYRSNDEKGSAEVYSEKNAAKSGIFIEDGYTLLSKFINNTL
ncbi:MAG: phosphoglycerate mutase, partial [Lachnoanaerobaculum sp.]|nr:phosphoglycerate mutase [Lachnoanaerobaculum sp.]